jgi:hypothetical protein
LSVYGAERPVLTITGLQTDQFYGLLSFFLGIEKEIQHEIISLAEPNHLYPQGPGPDYLHACRSVRGAR